MRLRYFQQALDIASGKLAVPALRYDNPNPNGRNYIRFDGIEVSADGKTTILIDRKTKLAAWTKKIADDKIKDVRRIEKAVAQNPGTKVVWEFPDQKTANDAKDFFNRNRLADILSIRVRTQ